MNLYEEKYNEILEWARKNKARLNGVPIEEVLPELAESEDEKALRIIRKRMCYDPVPISDEDRRIVENWLEKQKEQKPWEWSEEDEKYLNRVINLWVNDFGEDNDTVKWLKSLRPSWKPSEEQQDAARGK